MTKTSIISKLISPIMKMPKTKREDLIVGYSFMAPFFILMMVFVVWVFINNFFISLTDAYGVNPAKFIGLTNFVGVLTNKEFWYSVYITFKYAIICIITQIPLAFILANILNSIPFKRWKIWLRAAFFIPYLIASVVAGVLFGSLFGGDPGMVNWFLRLLHLPHQFLWFRNPDLHFPMLVIITFWQWIGFQSVYFLASLQTIDQSLYEAARMDGASVRQIFLEITIPLMRPAITFITVISAISFLMLFDLVIVLGLYTRHTMSMMVYIVGSSLTYDFNLAWGSAAGWVAFLLIFAVSIIQIRFLGLGKAGEE